MLKKKVSTTLIVAIRLKIAIIKSVDKKEKYYDICNYFSPYSALSPLVNV